MNRRLEKFIGYRKRDKEIRELEKALKAKKIELLKFRKSCCHNLQIRCSKQLRGIVELETVSIYQCLLCGQANMNQTVKKLNGSEENVQPVIFDIEKYQLGEDSEKTLDEIESICENVINENQDKTLEEQLKEVEKELRKLEK